MQLRMMNVVGAGLLVMATALFGCGGSDNNSSESSSGGGTTGSTTPAQMAGKAVGKASGGVELTGAGSTFDKPFFAAAFYDYQQKNGVKVNYQAIGSGGGIQQFTKGLVDFGATDVPMNAKELSAAQTAGGPVVQIPIALGATAIAYNLSGVQSVKLSPKVLADIYLGKVKNWNDPEIKSINGGTNLPAQPITVAHRSDGSGTTYIFTDYLSSVSPEWAQKVGKGKSVNWPVGVGGKGNDGVAGVISQTPGSIGYVELAYVLQTKMTAATVQNASGQFVAASLESAKAAASQFPQVSATKFSIVNAPGATSYPICGYSWLVVYQNQKDANKGKALKDLINWLSTDAQTTDAQKLDYVPLPSNVQQLAATAVDSIKV